MQNVRLIARPSSAGECAGVSLWTVFGLGVVVGGWSGEGGLPWAMSNGNLTQMQTAKGNLMDFR